MNSKENFPVPKSDSNELDALEEMKKQNRTVEILKTTSIPRVKNNEANENFIKSVFQKPEK